VSPLRAIIALTVALMCGGIALLATSAVLGDSRLRPWGFAAIATGAAISLVPLAALAVVRVRDRRR
jgi:hypothetical protein